MGLTSAFAGSPVYKFVTEGVTPSDDISVRITDTDARYAGVVGKKLNENVDYKLSWSNNNGVTGKKKAKYTVTFIGNYKGHAKLSGEYDITRGDFASSATFAGANITVQDMIYTKAAKYEPIPMVSIGNTLLKKSDYDVAYYDEEGVPTKGVKITLGDTEQYKRMLIKVTGKGSYQPPFQMGVYF